jgi:hypothetical protein
MASRAALLHGAHQAGKFLGDFDLVASRASAISRIKVFDLAASEDVPVMFQALDGLLGAYMCRDNSPGILVTTKRPLSVQRFTCAHELGHYYMKHDESFDDERHIGESWHPIVAVPEQEVEANAFAFSLLMPRWLVQKHLKALAAAGISKDLILCIYQLSLRLGTSYLATISTLQNYGLATPRMVRELKSVEPKQIKERLLRGWKPPDFNRAVWLLTEADRDLDIEAHVGDIFVLQFHSGATAGFFVDANTLEDHGFHVLFERPMVPAVPVGGAGDDSLTGFTPFETGVEAQKAGDQPLHLQQSRAFASDTPRINSIDAPVFVRESWKKGLSVEERAATLAIRRQSDSDPV